MARHSAARRSPAGPARHRAPVPGRARSAPPTGRLHRAGRALLAAALLGGAVAATGAVSDGNAGAVPANLVVNSGFDDGTAGWTVAAGTRIDVIGSRTGAAVRLTQPVADRYTVVLNDARNTVARTVAGETYTASVWVHTTRPGVSVALRLMEYAGVARVGEASAPGRLSGTGWQRIDLTYVARSSGASLDLNVLGHQLPRGTGLDIDDVRLSGPAGATPAPAAPVADPAAQLPGWRLAWSDEFTGDRLDATRWWAEHLSTYGDGNDELACLMNRERNLAVSDGVLKLVATREPTPLHCGDADARFPGGRTYTSAHLSTRRIADFRYGRFEIRAQLPTRAGTSKGLWPAFWLRPTAGGVGELDVLEAIGSGRGGDEWNRVHQTIWYDYAGTHRRQPTTVVFPQGGPSDGMHVYAAEWEPGEIRWYVDGRLTYVRDRRTTPWLDEAFGRPMYLRLNLAVGGGWPGTPDADTTFPATFMVDYVRVYQR